MKIFKTEKVIYFNTKYLPSKFNPESDNIFSKPKESSMNKFIYHKNNLYPQQFLNKKLLHFHVIKYDSQDMK